MRRNGVCIHPAHAPSRTNTCISIASAISAILAGVSVARAADDDVALEEVVVTAQKRPEDMQSVPISIVALGTEKLEQLHVENLDDYVKLLPSVAYVRGRGQGGNGQPGSSQIYMRGVASGGDGNRAGSQPSVGVYLDEQPVTTTSGNLDVHVYDIERVEVLAGPQGTLYGASSQAGTIRIITNKPDASAFAAAFDAGLSSVAHGGTGYQAEGFLNIPITSSAALRVVGWAERDAGYIDNVAGSNKQGCIVNGVRTFPTWAGQPAGGAAPCPTPAAIGSGSISNAAYVQKDYNTVDIRGGRAALQVNLNDSWTITPTIMGQSVASDGSFGFDPAVGDLKVAHFAPESSDDSWVQAALAVAGKISDLDVVYAGAFLKRDMHSIADYSDYSLFYDRLFGSGAYWQGNDQLPIDPQALILSKDYFQKWSHELRISTPKDRMLSATVGVFAQRQLHNFWLQYVLPGFGFSDPSGGNAGGFARALSIPGLDNTLWLTDQQRVDRDQAVFAEGTWTIDPQWSLTAGVRFFKSDNSQQGFFGYSLNFDKLLGYVGPGVPANPPPGMANCGGRGLAQTTYAPFKGAPCTNLFNTVKQTGHVPRVNLTYRVASDALLYATYSKGFRPGGVNRISDATLGGPYEPDYLTNYELGWKSEWFGNRLRWNGALFWEDWKNFQFSFLGPYSGTIITNGGQARIKGVESELEWAASQGLTLGASFTFLDATLQQNYCGVAGVTDCPNLATRIPFAPGGAVTVTGPLAAAGARLPVSPRFKGNLQARYRLAPFGGWQPHVQAAFTYQTETAPLLRTVDQLVVGMQPAYGLLDLSAGVERNGVDVQLLVTNATDRRAELTRFVQCKVTVCEQPYVITAQPRTIAVRFGKRF